jgi:hypothetical protein
LRLRWVVCVCSEWADGENSERLATVRTTPSKTATRAREAHLGSERILHANSWIVNIAVRTIGIRSVCGMCPDLHQRGVAAKLVTENLDGRLDSYAFRRAGGPVTDLWCTEPGCRRHVHDLCLVIC